MNSKGDVFTPLLYLGIIVFLLSGIALSLLSRPTENLGELQSQFIYAKQEVLEAQTQMDTLAKRIVLDDIYEIARSGGYSSDPACGNYFGLSLWSAPNPYREYSECIPDVALELSSEIESSFREDVSEFPNAYEVWVEDSLNVSGIALEPYIVDISQGRSYAERLGFSLAYNYDFRTYAVISDFLKVVSDECSDKENQKEKTDLDTCVLVVADRYGISVLHPLYFSRNEDEYAKSSFEEMLRVLQGTTYAQCFHSFEPVAADSTIYDVYSFDEVSLDGDGISIAVNEGLSTPLPRFPLPKTLFYEPSKKILEVDGFKFGLNQLNFYTYAKDGWVFFERGDDSYVEANLEYQPCSYENRKYLFKLEKNAFYPGEAPIEYFFSAFIKDDLSVELPSLLAYDKPFDEDAMFIRWKHTPSLDLDHYELRIDGEKVLEVRPWADVLVKDSIDWDAGDEVSYCNLEEADGFMQCQYLVDGRRFLFEDERVYYFLDSSEFVYVANVLDGLHEIELVAIDDDFNSRNMSVLGDSMDDLPFEALSYTLTEQPNPTQPELIQTILVSVAPPLFNLDGSQANDIASSYRFYQEPDVKYIYQNVGLVDIIAPNPPAEIGASLGMIVVAEDEGLDNLDLSLEEMGYTTARLQ